MVILIRNKSDCLFILFSINFSLYLVKIAKGVTLPGGKLSVYK